MLDVSDTYFDGFFMGADDFTVNEIEASRFVRERTLEKAVKK
jgi:hypothetical protein